MASSGHDTQNGLPFYLSPQQQQLLLQALASGEGKQAARQATSNSAFSLTPLSPEASPEHHNIVYEEPRGSSYLDGYDVDFGADSSFDFDISTLSNPVNDDGTGSGGSESPENDGPDKRAREDGEEGDLSPPGNEAKRREGTEKVPKKPGRKPLTSEPTSKRKAQNRAAQRAFRERKEKHLKDLETKVVELEKKSDKSHSENSTLRKQLQAVTAELIEYKRKVRQINSGGAVARDRPTPGVGNQGLQNLNNIDFQFEFPKFGYLPGPPQANSAQNNAKAKGQQKSSSTSPPNPLRAHNLNGPAGPNSRNAPGTINGQSANVTDVNRSPTSQYEPYNTLPVSRTSVDSGHYSLGSATTGSPSGSSHSYLGTSSSCGTSPEPYNQSPLGFKPVDTMATIGEEQPTMPPANNAQMGALNNLSSEMSFDWLAQQNGGQFDPQLFSDYREPQSNILNVEDSFFSDALDADFFTPYNVPPTGMQPKKNPLAQINEQRDAVDPVVVKNEPASHSTLDCEDVWEKIQNCDKVQAGSFDLDSLCSELQKKAKCSGDGPAVQEQEFDAILKKYLGPDFVKKCGGMVGHHQESSQKV